MKTPVLVGVDGGASGVRVARVERRSDGSVAPHVLARACDVASGARAWIDATAELVAKVSAGEPALVGIGMPGRKTRDRRGIASAVHGPTEPRFLALLTDELTRRGALLVAPISQLDDDGLLGCAGECFGAGGALRGVSFAYLLGAGTGLAEAFLLDGRPIEFEATPRPVQRAYHIDRAGRTFEERLSVGGLNRAYLARGGGKARFEAGLEERESVARELIHELADDIVALVALREATLCRAFERIVVAQRLAQLLGTEVARAEFTSALAARRPVVLSQLAASNVIGAASLAFERHRSP